MTPLAYELLWFSPSWWANALVSKSGFVWLDAGEGTTQEGRYSYIGFEPFKTLHLTLGDACDAMNRDRESKGEHRFEIQIEEGSPAVQEPSFPFQWLKQQMSPYALDPYDDVPPFQGGFMGALSYDLSRILFLWSQRHTLPPSTPLVVGGLYSTIIAFDHHLKTSYCFCNGLSDGIVDEAVRAEQAEKEWAGIVDMMVALEAPSEDLEVVVAPEHRGIQSDFTDNEYEVAVRHIQEAIRAGDIFEANLTQAFTAALPSHLTPWQLYVRLKKSHHAPFGAYIAVEGMHLLSLSPECFIKVKDKRVETRPIKGTRPRGTTSAQDERLREELLASEKDRAENVMIVDLMRNDLSRVCQPGSVQVTSLCALESYTTVHHLTSVVQGMLREGQDSFALLEATFPAGSITGAPKRRAMEILDSTEKNPRGFYCGSIGYVGFDGCLSLSVAIRTATIIKGQVTFNAGGAIVLDSSPEQEVQECHNKAKAWKEALGG